MRFKIKKILILVIGILLGFGATVLAEYALHAEDIIYTPKNSNFNVDNVSDALKVLYDSVGSDVGTINVSLDNKYQLPKLSNDTYTYESDNKSIATVSSSGLVTRTGLGDVIVSVKNSGKTVLKYNLLNNSSNLLVVTGGKLSSNSTAHETYSSADDSKNITDLLTDGDTSRKESYGAVLLGALYGSSYMYFTVYDNVNISFSSTSFSNSAGSSGKVAYFYKVDDKGNETLHYQLTQLNNTKDYGVHYFPKGNYVLRAKANWVIFDEFHISPA